VRARRIVARGAAVLAMAALLGACSSARTDVGTSANSCYQAIPVASEAVADHGHLAGVRKETLASLRGLAPGLADVLADQVPAGQAVCLVAYDGHFASADVAKPLGRGHGTVAVAVVTWPGKKLLATLVLERIPPRFGHTHPF